MAQNRIITSYLLILNAVLIDIVIGDPKRIIHPVQVIGYGVRYLKRVSYFLAKDNKIALRISGFFVAIIIVSLSGFSGWIIEQICIKNSFLPDFFSGLILAIPLSSSLAFKSLKESSLNVIQCLEDKHKVNGLEKSRKALGQIVGRNVDELKEDEILRAVAETASENSVDGVFGPLFWIFFGGLLWEISLSFPGPLSFAWAFKASSTLDSMIGYRKGNLEWFGTASARLDDVLTFIPCRLVVITLPLISRNWRFFPTIVRRAIRDSKDDLSPNSGLSEAIFAHCTNTRMGGKNHYGEDIIYKPILSNSSPKAKAFNIKNILNLCFMLEITWTICIVLMLIVL